MMAIRSIGNAVLVVAALLAMAPMVAKADAGSGAVPAPSAVLSAEGPETPAQLEARIAKLVRLLGDPEYSIRQAAHHELSTIGLAALDALAAAQKDDDVEIASRAKGLVAEVGMTWVRSDAAPQVKEILANYEIAGPGDRLQKMHSLALLHDDMGLAPLCRLVRLEELVAVAKQGAWFVIGQPDPPADAWTNRIRTIEKNLGTSGNLGVEWLRAYVQIHDKPVDAKAACDRLVAAELAAMSAADRESQTEALLPIAKRLVEVLEERFKRRDKSIEVMRRIAESIPSDSSSKEKIEQLKDVVDWLLVEQAWDQVEGLAKAHSQEFDSNVILMYMRAASYRAGGQSQLAGELSRKAFDAVGDGRDEHWKVAKELSRRGLIEAAEKEFRHLISTAPKPGSENDETGAASLALAEMLHEQSRDADAADVLKPLVAAMHRDSEPGKSVKQESTLFEPEARMHFFYACDAAAHAHPDKEREELQRAITKSPDDVDVLIALYERSSSDQAERRRALELIQAADEKFRAALAQDSVNTYNQDAWLIGNTEGNFDLAIQFSRTAVDLFSKNLSVQPTDVEDVHADDQLAGLVDTLAHCYAGKGDWESAVKYQAWSMELDPHQPQIRQAFQKFSARYKAKQETKSVTQ
jgi:tetratricopeptide (TPR) repeat protein